MSTPENTADTAELVEETTDVKERFGAAEMRLIEYAQEHERPITAAQARKMLRLIRKGAHYYQAAAALGLNKRSFQNWRKRGLSKSPKRLFYRILLKAVQQAEAAAISDCESKVKAENPLAWLARRARSRPGYIGWEPDAVKLQLSGDEGGPIEINHQGEITAEHTAPRLLEALAVLRSLGLANEQMLLGVQGEASHPDDTDLE